MDHWLFWPVFFLAGLVIYRKLARWRSTPKTRVNALLRRYRALERRGLPQRDCLLQLLMTSKGWNKLPHRFLAEIVSRFSTLEDTVRFMSISEDYGYVRDHYTSLAGQPDLEAAMREIAVLFARFGLKLQEEGRYKEAAFVQKLALLLQPGQYFTKLPLAVSYYEMEQFDDALPLFEGGLAPVSGDVEPSQTPEHETVAKNPLWTDAEMRKYRNRCKKLYAACLKAAERKAM
ncbi:MAG: hypothetical protein GTO40_00165, partial [Deltaproteobacteria bacterium]|nr:hypothetical protein [Deltaproteobacteria bacterium]